MEGLLSTGPTPSSFLESHSPHIQKARKSSRETKLVERGFFSGKELCLEYILFQKLSLSTHREACLWSWPVQAKLMLKGSLPEGFCTVRFPSSSRTGPPPIAEVGRMGLGPSSNQRLLGFQLFRSSREAALYTTAFSGDFRALDGRLSCL